MDTGAPFDRFSSPGKPAIAKDIQENGHQFKKLVFFI
jgi:hypothetical protein